MSSQAAGLTAESDAADSTTHNWLRFYDPEVPAHLPYPRVPIYQMLDDSAAQRPGRTCAIFFGKRFTYRQIKTLSDRFAAGMRSVKEPLSPPSVEEDRIDPPFTAATWATEPADALNVPSSIVTAICPSRMIFERSAWLPEEEELAAG
jgi:hypothetical protein